MKKLLFIVSTIFCIQSFAQKNSHSLSFTLQLDSANSNLSKGDLAIVYELTSYSKKTIKVPGNIYMSESPAADVRYQVEKYADSSGVFISQVHTFSPAYVREPAYRNLFFREKVRNSTKFPFVFPGNGLYRIRLIFHLSRYNKNTQDPITDWLVFRIG